ncbi:MAG: phosphoribosylanthranilate isomerase [Acidobacteria bacterium]|nr:phosphoribosylanthranilate isomerase [Acidobacteriota bacterium]
MFVKICGITNAADALLAVAMGAEVLGFIFAESSRQIAPELAGEIIQQLPYDVTAVGVFRNQPTEQILEIASIARLTGVQLHGQEMPGEAALLRRRVPFLVQAFAADDPRLTKVDDYDVDAVLLDAPTPGSGEVFDWDLVGTLPHRHRVILAGGLTAENVRGAVEAVRPWGVDVASGVEAEPGRKDPVKLRHFINAATDALSEFSIDPKHA